MKKLIVGLVAVAVLALVAVPAMADQMVINGTPSAKCDVELEIEMYAMITPPASPIELVVHNPTASSENPVSGSAADGYADGVFHITTNFKAEAQVIINKTGSGPGTWEVKWSTPPYQGCYQYWLNDPTNDQDLTAHVKVWGITMEDPAADYGKQAEVTVTVFDARGV